MAKKDTKKDTPRVMTWKFSEHFLEYEEWFARFEDEINIELAETGGLIRKWILTVSVNLKKDTKCT